MKTLRSRFFSLASICLTSALAAGCTVQGNPSPEGEDGAGQEEPAADNDLHEAAAPTPFLEITDAHGGALQFFVDGGEIGIGVAATYPNRPIVPSRFIERHGAAEVFVAAAADGAELPAEMAGRMRTEDRELVNDPGRRTELRAELAAARAAAPGLEADAKLPAPPDPPLCSNSFRNWVNDVYGGSECGLVTVAAHSDSVSATYCSSGCDASIYFFGSAGDCQSSLSGCGGGVFTGDATNVNARRVESNIDYSFNHAGFRSHFAAANCAATASPTAINFKRQYGAGSWASQSVPVGSMYHYYSGRPMTQQGAGWYGINYASYRDSAAEYTHQMAIEDNTQSGDAAIFCADVLTDYDGNAPNCGGCNWCTAATPCNGCFSNCAGN